MSHYTKVIVTMLLLFTLTGCTLLPWEKPEPTESTAISGGETEIANRGWGEQTVNYANISMQHKPLYFMVCNEIAPCPIFTKIDFIQEQIDPYYERLDFNRNLLLLPVSMAMKYPWEPEISRDNTVIQKAVFEIPGN